MLPSGGSAEGGEGLPLRGRLNPAHPGEAGIQKASSEVGSRNRGVEPAKLGGWVWIPAFAGMCGEF